MRIARRDNNCEKEITELNKFYKATCYETAKQIAKRLKIKSSDYIISFQSRLDNKWLRPFSDEIVKKRGQNGYKKILVSLLHLLQTFGDNNRNR